MVITIRKARPQDALFLAETERLIAKEPGFLCSTPEELDPEQFKLTIEKLQNEKQGVYLVAEEQEKIAGHGYLLKLPLKNLSHVAQLTIALHPTWQGKGVGMQLMEALINWAEKDPSVEKIELNVRATNERAIRLYKKWGFRLEGFLTQRLKVNARYIDDLVMGLHLRGEAPQPQLPDLIRTGAYAVARSQDTLLTVKQLSGPYAGKYDLPGGKIEIGESVEAALRRELAEEVDMGFAEMRFFANLTTTAKFHQGLRGSPSLFHQIGLIYLVAGLYPLKLNPETTMPFSWMKLSELNSQTASPFLVYVSEHL